ncbi:hypothetical protein MTR_7g110910 [Medicago truncatula]|uniref:F-box domain-containing protein n=1 Tax=Medicago truncatula TaxID=3880 RepID=G7KVG5_MEDTR|nr:hypothetical protein MTR_7g110910 [Medicago truncatula]
MCLRDDKGNFVAAKTSWLKGLPQPRRKFASEEINTKLGEMTRLYVRIDCIRGDKGDFVAPKTYWFKGLPQSREAEIRSMTMTLALSTLQIRRHEYSGDLNIVIFVDFVCYICGNTHSIKPYILYRFLQTLNNSIKYIFFLPRLKNYNMKKVNKNPKTMVCSYVEYDRLSNLSDDLIYRILSFLSTKESYRTCVLSIDGG